VGDDDLVACVTTSANGAEGFGGGAVAAAVEALASVDVTPDG
jgi:L-cystine uptake protein TcyP (sodium:dicarboxylate symporter family)